MVYICRVIKSHNEFVSNQASIFRIPLNKHLEGLRLIYQHIWPSPVLLWVVSDSTILFLLVILGLLHIAVSQNFWMKGYNINQTSLQCKYFFTLQKSVFFPTRHIFFRGVWVRYHIYVISEDSNPFKDRTKCLFWGYITYHSRSQLEVPHAGLIHIPWKTLLSYIKCVQYPCIALLGKNG